MPGSGVIVTRREAVILKREAGALGSEKMSRVTVLGSGLRVLVTRFKV